MKEKLVELIKNSSMLKEGDKETYLVMLDSLSEDRMQDLLVILEKEYEIKAEIDTDTENKVSGANKEYIAEIKSTYKEEKDKAVAATEVDDSQKAEEMISNI